MKHTYTLSALLLIASIATPALALDGNVETNIDARATSTIRTQIRDAIQSKRDNLKRAKEDFKNLRASTTAAIKEDIHRVRVDFRVGEAKAREESTVKVLTATANRLDKIVARIESRLSKLEIAGGVTTNARADVSTAKANLVDARAHIATLNLIDLSGSTTTMSTNFQMARTEAEAARKSLQSARDNLETAVSVIRTIEKTVHIADEATSTESH